MSKKLLAKQWLSLQEAADLLTSRTGEQFSVNDIIYFICEKKIRVCWNLHMTQGREVAPMSRMVPDFSALIEEHDDSDQDIYKFDPISLLLNHPEKVTYRWETTVGSVSGVDGYIPDARLHGLYSLDLGINSGIEAYLRSYLIGIHEPVMCPDGFYVCDESGSYYQILDVLDDLQNTPWDTQIVNRLAAIEDDLKRKEAAEEEKVKFIQRTANSYLSKEQKTRSIKEFAEKIEGIKFGDFEDKKYCAHLYYPTDRKPELDELAVRPADIEDFISSLASSNTENRNAELSPKTKNMYLRLILALIDCTIDGLTGESTVDARACIAALESKGIKVPIGERALINYIEEARKLD